MTRRFIRQRGGVPASGFEPAEALREALDANGGAELWDATHAAEPRFVFTFQARGIAVLVVNPTGQHLGTFADPVRAVAHAFDLLDRAAEQQRATCPRSKRARQRTAKEPIP